MQEETNISNEISDLDGPNEDLDGCETPEQEEIELNGEKVKKMDLHKDDVLQLIDEGKIIPDYPPTTKYTAPHWEKGIKFLYWNCNLDEIEDDTNENIRKSNQNSNNNTNNVFADWYHCEVCKWTHKIKKLRDGTSVLKNHADKHDKEVKYCLKESELRTFVAKAATFGQMYGRIHQDDFPLPLPNKWFVLFQILVLVLVLITCYDLSI